MLTHPNFDPIAIAIGPVAKSIAAGGVSIGLNSVATNANDVALGANSVTAAPVNAGPFTLNGGTAAATAPIGPLRPPSAGVVAVSRPGAWVGPDGTGQAAEVHIGFCFVRGEEGTQV